MKLTKTEQKKLKRAIADGDAGKCIPCWYNPDMTLRSEEYVETNGCSKCTATFPRMTVYTCPCDHYTKAHVLRKAKQILAEQ